MLSSIWLLIIIPLILLVVLILNFYLPKFTSSSEKLSPYECGMNPLGSSRERFSVQFILVGILFLIFDLEILFLFPFLISFYSISYYGYWVVVTFLIILTIGLVYELSSGAIDLDHSSEGLQGSGVEPGSRLPPMEKLKISE